MVGVGSDVLEDERARRRDDQNLQHKVVKSLEKDFAESFSCDRIAFVVAKGCCPLGEILTSETLVYIHFKLVTDAFDFYTPRETN